MSNTNTSKQTKKVKKSIPVNDTIPAPASQEQSKKTADKGKKNRDICNNCGSILTEEERKINRYKHNIRCKNCYLVKTCPDCKKIFSGLYYRCSKCQYNAIKKSDNFQEKKKERQREAAARKDTRILERTKKHTEEAIKKAELIAEQKKETEIKRAVNRQILNSITDTTYIEIYKKFGGESVETMPILKIIEFIKTKFDEGATLDI